jgi:hypothetical protein
VCNPTAAIDEEIDEVEERPDALLAQLLTFFGEEQAHYDTTGAEDVDGV